MGISQAGVYAAEKYGYPASLGAVAGMALSSSVVALITRAIDDQRNEKQELLLSTVAGGSMITAFHLINAIRK